MIKKNILITGCAGFIGSSVARELIKKKIKFGVLIIFQEEKGIIFLKI